MTWWYRHMPCSKSTCGVFLFVLRDDTRTCYGVRADCQRDRCGWKRWRCGSRTHWARQRSRTRPTSWTRSSSSTTTSTGGTWPWSGTRPPIWCEPWPPHIPLTTARSCSAVAVADVECAAQGSVLPGWQAGDRGAPRQPCDGRRLQRRREVHGPRTVRAV
eukprot:3935833-Rhodomonas_salina.1